MPMLGHVWPCSVCIPCLLGPCSWSSFELRTLCSAAERTVSILNLDRELWRGRTGPEKTGVPSETMCTTATPTLPCAQVVSHAHVSEPCQFNIAQGAGLWIENTLATCPRTCSRVLLHIPQHLHCHIGLQPEERTLRTRVHTT